MEHFLWICTLVFYSPSQFVVIASTLTSSGLKYDDYIFPNWANIVGWSVAMSSMVFVPLYAIYKFFSVPGTFREVSIKLHDRGGVGLGGGAGVCPC